MENAVSYFSVLNNADSKNQSAIKPVLTKQFFLLAGSVLLKRNIPLQTQAIIRFILSEKSVIKGQAGKVHGHLVVVAIERTSLRQE